MGYPPFHRFFCRACRNKKSPVTVVKTVTGLCKGGSLLRKTKTPGRKNSLLNVSDKDKTRVERSDSVKYHQSNWIDQ
jgi:hypothetical protein